MINIIHKLHAILNQFKGFEAGYTSEDKKAMIIKYDNTNYKITIEKLGEGDIMSHIKNNLG